MASVSWQYSEDQSSSLCAGRTGAAADVAPDRGDTKESRRAKAPNALSFSTVMVARPAMTRTRHAYIKGSVSFDTAAGARDLSYSTLGDVSAATLLCRSRSYQLARQPPDISLDAFYEFTS
jgi:hypothetical protein